MDDIIGTTEMWKNWGFDWDGHLGMTIPFVESGSIAGALRGSRPAPLLKEFLPGLRAGRVGIISASGSTGKSFFCLEYACAQAIGESIWGNFLPILNEPKRVLYIAAEEDHTDVVDRLVAIGKHFDVFDNYADLIKDNLTILTTENFPISIFSQDGNINLDGIKKINAACDLCQPDIIIADPLVQFHSANENDNGQMTTVMKVFRSIASIRNVPVLLTHHTGKSAVLNGQTAMQQSSRGASAIVDSARWVMTLAKPIEKNSEGENKEDQYRVVASWPKLNNHAPIEPVTFYRYPGGVLDVVPEESFFIGGRK